MDKSTIDGQREAIRLTELWQNHGPNTYPLDIDALIEGAIRNSGFADQLFVRRREFSSIEGSLVRTEGQRKWTILLNTKIRNARRLRFTFAHELGHFMCHRNLQQSFEDSQDSLNDFKNNIEAEANVFASWLLMPANLVRSEFSDVPWNVETLRSVGNRFECSLQASALRYVQLSSRKLAFIVSRDGMILWATKSRSAPFITNFCFGDELPVGSFAQQAYLNNGCETSESKVGTAWCDSLEATESQYFDQSGQGYQYTCIQFD